MEKIETVTNGATLRKFDHYSAIGPLNAKASMKYIFLFTILTFNTAHIFNCQCAATEAIKLPKSEPSANVTAVLTSSDGTQWVSVEEGALWRIRGDNITKVPLPDPYCYALAEDKEGRIWAGTGRHRVAVWTGAAWTSIGPDKGLAGYHVYALLAAADGSVWIATEAGVSRISSAGELTTFQVKDGLPTNEVASIAEDRAGNIMEVLIQSFQACSSIKSKGLWD